MKHRSLKLIEELLTCLNNIEIIHCFLSISVFFLSTEELRPVKMLGVSLSLIAKMSRPVEVIRFLYAPLAAFSSKPQVSGFLF